MDHDQNFKNLILDYPRGVPAFLAEAEARAITPEVRITPVRQEQLKERLGERFRELDVPLLHDQGPGCALWYSRGELPVTPSVRSHAHVG